MASALDTQGEVTPRREQEKAPLATKTPDLASAKLLEDLTRLFITDVTAYDDPAFLQHVSPEFQWNIVGSFLGHGREEHFDTMKRIRKVFPDYHVDILNLCAEVQIGKAKTWAVMKITGFPEGVERESILMFSWRRDVNGTWVCQRHDGIRGVAPMPALISQAMPLDDS